jgi:outer membrane protein OmpA-like peptidoglycan-associated protein
MTVRIQGVECPRLCLLATGMALAIVFATPAGAQNANDIIRSLAPIAPSSYGPGSKIAPPKDTLPPDYGPRAHRPGKHPQTAYPDRAYPPIYMPGPKVRSVHYSDRDGRTTDYMLDFQYTYDLVVNFPYNSVELTGRAKGQLAALGRALQSPQLRPYRYMIAGHTDSVGSPEYNRELSIHRAEVVSRYLLDHFDIDPRRLVSTGWGATEPRDPQNPDSGVNRRVEVVMIVDPAMAPAAHEGAPPFRSGPPPERLGASGPCDPNAVRQNAGRPGTLDDFEGCDGRFDAPPPR